MRAGLPGCGAGRRTASGLGRHPRLKCAPGHYLGIHTDSAEEILLLLSGTVEARLGEETGRLAAGQAALIPAMVPHGVRNTGDELARCGGFFAAAAVASTFDRPLLPFGRRAVGTPPVESIG